MTDLHLKSLYEPTIYMRHRNHIMPFITMPIEKYKRFVTYLQYRAQLDFNSLSKPQTGAFQLVLNQQTFYFRLSYLPSSKDAHFVLRILNHFNMVSFNKLSNDQRILNDFRNIIKKENGMIIVCGPTGSGKSTTLHCFLEEINRQENKSIVTIEDPIEIFIPGIIQIQVNENMGLTFDSILEQVLRHDPDVIMIGELRNEYSAKIALKLSLTGHLVLTTLHASDGKAALKRLLNLNFDIDELKQIALAIITQRLFYKTNTGEPFVVFERILKEDIINELNHMPTNYRTLLQEIENHHNQGDLSDEDFQKYF